MIYRKIQKLEEETGKQDQIDGNQWTRFRERSEVDDDEERWMNYAERALSLLNHELVWQGIVGVCKILKYPEPSASHREYFESLFEFSCFVWFQIYSESERTVSIDNLLDYVVCVYKLKCNMTM
jgi:hypothetical protein